MMARRWLAGLLSMLCASALLAAAPEDSERARLAIRTKQFTQAVELLRSQARTGSRDAQYLLGLALWNGVGVRPDLDAARELLRQAAGSGHAAAAHALASLLSVGGTDDRREAATWLARAAKDGYTPALMLQAAHTLALADARGAPGLATELRFEIARAAAHDDDVALLTAAGVREFAQRRGEFGRTLLFDSAGAAAVETTRLLLASGAAPDAQDEYGVTALMLAATQPDVALTRLLLSSGALVNHADQAGRTALFSAAAANQAGQISQLLAAGAHLGQSDRDGWTAFDLAQQRNSLAALDVLHAAGAHATQSLAAVHGATGVDATRPGALYAGWPPLAIAASRDDAEDIRRRRAAGADLEATTPQGATALQVAIESRAGNAARTLVELGANLDHAGSDGLGALERVVRSGDAGLFSDLTARGAKISSEAQGAKLIAAAVRRADLAMTRALLAAGVPASATDSAGVTPLMNAARIAHVELLKLLVDRGAAVEARDARGRSALWYAAAAGHAPSVSLLLSVRASPDASDREGTTALLAAVRSGSREALESLLAAGGNVDASVPPLNAAAAMGRLDMVSALLSRKPPLDKLDSFGDTALMAAARKGDEATSLRLLAAGANPRLRNRERATAADLAEARGFHTLAQRLRD